MNRKSIKLLHTSDLHLGMNKGKELEGLPAVTKFAMEQQVDLMIIAGDLFDHSRISDDIAETAAEQLQAIGCPIVILAGNHDCLIPGSVLDRPMLWSKYDHVKIFSSERGETMDWPDLGISIWGKSITSEYDDIKPLEGIPDPGNNGHWYVAVAHGFYVDRYPALVPSYHILKEDLTGLTWDYIALGHVPVFRCVSEKPLAYYSGSPSYSKTSALVELSEDMGVVVTCCEF